MPMRAVIVGSGPAAAGAALGLLQSPDVEVTVVDLGGTLEPKNAQARDRMGSGTPQAWNAADLALISRLPEESEAEGLPEKRSFGSDFPFRDLGQLRDIVVNDGVNDALISSAYGGFSNVWGAQVMPFTTATFREWPFAAEEIYPHYREVLNAMPYAAEEDDLAGLFPILADSQNLPLLSERSSAILSRYARGRKRINRAGVMVGRARLAMQAQQCIRCGLCMTGCPYGLIYSASETWDTLRQNPRLTYRGGLMAVRLTETEEHAAVVARDLRTGAVTEITADRIYVACGAIGTTRLVMGSLGLFGVPVRVSESTQFTLPFVSMRPVRDPRTTADFTLNQFNMIVSLDREGYDISQLHFYTYNPVFEQALPHMLRRTRLRGMRTEMLRRLSVALGYVPSWVAPTFSLVASRSSAENALPVLSVSDDRSRLGVRRRFMRQVLTRIMAAAPDLDCWPLVPFLRHAAPGKSYHFGGTFPHSARPAGDFSSDVLGRVGPWRRIHLTDASVFPTVAATTYTLTAMANAHRIATTTLSSS